MGRLTGAVFSRDTTLIGTIVTNALHGSASMSAMLRNFTAITQRLREVREKNASPADGAAAHIASVEAQIAAIARGDYASAIANAHEDVALDIFAPPEFPWIRSTRGAQELQKAIEHNFGTLVDQRPEVTTLLAQEDVVVMIGREQRSE